MARSRGGARVDAWDPTTIVRGRWDAKGGATPTANLKGKGATVTRADVGVYTIVFDAVIRELYSYGCQLHMGTPDGSHADIVSASLASNGILTLTVWTTNPVHAKADIAAAAGNVVCWWIDAKRAGTR